MPRRGDRAGRSELRRDACSTLIKKLQPHRLGFEGNHLSLNGANQLAAMIGAEIQPASVSAAAAPRRRLDSMALVATDGVVERLRVVKDAHEIEMLRRGGAAAVAGGRRHSSTTSSRASSGAGAGRENRLADQIRPGSSAARSRRSSPADRIRPCRTPIPATACSGRATSWCWTLAGSTADTAST